MNLDPRPGEQELREAVREWLSANRPGPLADDPDERFEQLRGWQRELHAAGWLGFGWPEEYGGQGGDVLSQILFYQELALARAPLPATLVGLDVIGPTVLEHGSEDQKRRLLPPLLRGDEVWCQGFSEPGAGSDLAALRTRAKAEPGGGFVVSGQKVWTSTAQHADWCALLARTDPDAPKHRGISYLLVEMDAPGITVRPITQLSGDAEFSEVFFDEVRVPADGLLGRMNDGWGIAISTLAHERGPYTLRRQTELRVALDELVEQACGVVRAGRPLLDDEVVRQRLGRCEALVEAMGAQGYRTAARLQTGEAPAESSVDKLLLTQVEQEVLGFAADLCGSELWAPAGDGLDGAHWLRGYLDSRAASIYGGTAEIQRTIVAERLLGLPRG